MYFSVTCKSGLETAHAKSERLLFVSMAYVKHLKELRLSNSSTVSCRVSASKILVSMYLVVNSPR